MSLIGFRSRRYFSPHRFRRQNGFSLLEVLIALLVLNVGLLSLAYLQITSLQTNQVAEWRTQATHLVRDMAERMRANWSSVTSGLYNVNHGQALTVPNPDCISAPCTPQQLAAMDLYQWKTSLGRLLPAGDGQIAALGADLFEVTVRWDEARAGATGTACSSDPEVDLACVRLRISP